MCVQTIFCTAIPQYSLQTEICSGFQIRSQIWQGVFRSMFFFEGEHFDILIQNSDKNKNLTPSRPQKVSILKSSPLKNTGIEKNSTVVDRKFDSLSITVEFFDLQIFLQANFCQQTSTGSTGTRVSVHVLGNINRTWSGNLTTETVWWRQVLGICPQKFTPKKTAIEKTRR